MASVAPIQAHAPPTYTEAQKVVRYNGREYGVGERFTVHDHRGGVLTHAEVREGCILWVNASVLEKGLGTANLETILKWTDWCRQNGTKLLIQTLEGSGPCGESRVGDHRPSSMCSGVSNSLVIDTTRRQYQGADKDTIRGTWARIDLATAYIQHVDKNFHANWCKIMGKVYSGDHSAIADVLVETDRVAGTESVGEIVTCPKRAADDAAVTKRTRIKLGPTDFAYWVEKRGRDPVEALALIREAVVALTEVAVLNNPEALAAQKRAEEAERTCRARADEFERNEAAKRDTIDKEIEAMNRSIESTRATVAAIREMQAELKGLDVRFVAWRQLNYNWSLQAAAGPCVYALHIDGYIKIGHTGNSLFQRYKHDLWSHDMKELIILCMPHRNKKEAEQFERLVQAELKDIRCTVGNKREMFASDYVRVSAAFKEVYGDDDVRFV